MSTRSGKPIHTSLINITPDSKSEVQFKSEIKVRSKKPKDSIEEITTTHKAQKRNFVAYPSEDDPLPVDEKMSGNASNFVLKNKDTSLAENEQKKATRVTRHTKKFFDVEIDQLIITEDKDDIKEFNVIDQLTKTPAKAKKNNKSKIVVEEKENLEVKSKKKSKNKKAKRSGSLTVGSGLVIVEDLNSLSIRKEINKSNTSFHSAAGSPLKENMINKIVKEKQQPPRTPENVFKEKAVKKTKKGKKSKKAKVKSDKPDEVKEDKEKEIISEEIQEISTHKEQQPPKTPENDFKEKTVKKAKKEKKSKKAKVKSDKPDEVKDDKGKDKEKEIISREIREISTDKELSFEKKTSLRSSAHILPELKSPVHENKKSSPLNTTFDKESHLDSTDDKLEIDNDKLTKKEPILTGLTPGKTNTLKISVTSDDSRTENILNATPLLIECSLDCSPSTSKDSHKRTPVGKNTSLKREGTFTKDGPSPIIMSPAPKTPQKQDRISSPGRTPYPSNSKPFFKKSTLNLTRSLEKLTNRKSSIVETTQRQTRVMFCSPINNAAIVNQRTSKIIKSSMKGSNNTFVLEDTALKPESRKRSLTQRDSDETHAKRKRLCDNLQISVDRLSRPRTSAANDKPSATTPSKRASVVKPVSRTKLPNFKALHQKRFEKMESLDECQQRKKERARQLLTPKKNATDKDSNKAPAAQTNFLKKPEAPTKRPTPLSTFELPTLSSLRPGFTRFGFKLNLDTTNPFISTKDTDNVPNTKSEKKEKPSGLKRQATLPSINGATRRKEIAKQVVMKEINFSSHTEKRDTNRMEYRNFIKGVRTNRRFELQMKSRNING